MSLQYFVFNRTNGNLTFTVNLPLDEEKFMSIPSHRRRRMVKGSQFLFSVKQGQSVEIAELTGLSQEVLDRTPDLMRLREKSAISIEIIQTDDPSKPVVGPPSAKLDDDTKSVVRRRGRPRKIKE